jgi:hypothetical protein
VKSTIKTNKMDQEDKNHSKPTPSGGENSTYNSLPRSSANNNFPILSSRQIYPESSGRKLSPQKDFNCSTNSLNNDSNFGSRKFLNLIHDGSKFCLVQGDQQTTPNNGKTFKIRAEWMERSKLREQQPTTINM